MEVSEARSGSFPTEAAESRVPLVVLLGGPSGAGPRGPTAGPLIEPADKIFGYVAFRVWVGESSLPYFSSATGFMCAKVSLRFTSDGRLPLKSICWEEVVEGFRRDSSILLGLLISCGPPALVLPLGSSWTLCLGSAR